MEQQLKEMTKTDVLSTKLMSSLPIFQHLQIEKVGDKIGLDPNKWKKGEKGIYRVIAIALLAGAALVAWHYILPWLFVTLAKTLAVAAFAGILIFLYILRVPIYKLMRKISRKFQEALIRDDPFGELETQRDLRVGQKDKFMGARANIRSLRNSSQQDADKNESDAKEYSKQILRDKKDADALKVQLEELKKQGKLDTDEGVEIQTNYTKKLNSARRTQAQYDQAKIFVQKYGARAAAMGSMERKLALAGNAIDEEIKDFDISIDILKKEYEFAKNSRIATDAAKGALGFTQSWELKYAIEFVNESVAYNLAATSQNLEDIDALTAKYAVDDDRLYEELSVVSDKISTKEDAVPDASKYTNPSYKLTKEDKKAAGTFSDLFPG